MGMVRSAYDERSRQNGIWDRIRHQQVEKPAHDAAHLGYRQYSVPSED